MNENKTRIEWIDTARGIALILVIFGHLKTPYLATWIYTFHIPLFFFLSGCVYRQPISFKVFLEKKLRGLVIPYFCLGLVIWMFYEIINLVNGPEGSIYGNGLTMLWNLIKQQGYWTIWFLACLFVCQMIFYWIFRYCHENVYIMLCCSLAIAIVAFAYYRLGGKVLPWCIDIACVAQLFYTFGYFINHSARNDSLSILSRCSKWWASSFALLLVNCASGFANIRFSGKSLDMSIGMYGNESLSIVSALSGILFIVMISKRFNSRLLTYLGQNTMVIFGWHSRIGIVSLDYLYQRLGVFTDSSRQVLFMRSIVSFLLILVVFVPLTELIKRTKVRQLFGV